MSYLVLARKWRPTSFEEVVGQSHVTRTLKNAIQLDRVAHALLFTGSRGIGKTTCARLLACALNCEDGPRIDPPADDPICLEIMGGTSVDVFEIDGASNNSVEQIREIRESVKFLPTRGKRKIYIIDEVHMLSTSAFNALLKTLEEPPDHVLFIFATTEPGKIPDTIISRCQRFDFKRIPEGEIVGAIAKIATAEGLEVEDAALHHIAREAQGGMRDSLSLLDQVIAFCGNTIDEVQTREVLGIADRKVLYELTASVLAGDGRAALETIDALFRFGIDLQKFAAEFLSHLRDLIVVKVCPEAPHLVDLPQAEMASAAAQVAAVEPARLHRLFNAMMGCAEAVAASPFPKLVLEMSLLRLCQQGPTLPLAEVLDGLARLESRLGAEGPPDDGGPAPGALTPRTPAPSGGGGPATGGPSDAGPTMRAVVGAPAVAAVEQRPHLRIAEPPAPETEPEQNLEMAPAPEPVVEAAPAPEPVVEATPAPAKPARPASAPSGDPRDVADTFDALPPPVSFSTPPPAIDTPVRPDLSEPPSNVLPFTRETSVEPPEAEAEAVALISLTDGREPVEHFADLVGELRARDAFRASEIEQSVHLVRLDPTGIELAVSLQAPDDLRQSLGRLEAVINEALRGTFPLEIVRCERGDPRLAIETLYERKERLASEALEARRAAAADDPKVRLALDVLGAQILSVTPR